MVPFLGIPDRKLKEGKERRQGQLVERSQNER
jgi:hypothetical protein